MCFYADLELENNLGVSMWSDVTGSLRPSLHMPGQPCYMNLCNLITFTADPHLRVRVVLNVGKIVGLQLQTIFITDHLLVMFSTNPEDFL